MRFVWEDGAMTDLPEVNGSYGWPRAINDRGQVVGRSWWHAAFWTR